MTDTFGADYAAAYDHLYADKDYDTECDTLEAIFERGTRPVRTVLDLGCGTGAHAVRLAQRGYKVVGVDISDAMLYEARQRASTTAETIEFILGDVRSVRLDWQFDAVICMFAVMGYQTTDDDVGRALDTVRHHLTPGGPFIFDVWYGPAVVSVGPSKRTKVVETDHGPIERRASAVLDRDANLCTVSYQLVDRRTGVERMSEEHHRMRYYFRDDLEHFLTAADLALVELTPFPETAAPLSDSAWNVLAVAR